MKGVPPVQRKSKLLPIRACMDRVPPAMNMTSTSNWLCFRMPASLAMLNSTASVLAGELVPTRKVVSWAGDSSGHKRKKKIESAPKTRAVALGFCMTISASILLALELKQLRSGVNREGKESSLRRGADFAYIGTKRSPYIIIVESFRGLRKFSGGP